MFINPDYIVKIQHSKMKSKRISIAGYKHAMVQAFSFAIASNKVLKLKNVPHLLETEVLCSLFINSGGVIEQKNDILVIDPRNIYTPVMNEELCSQIHGSMYLVPAFAARMGRAQFTGAGGCPIGEDGSRPFQHVTKVLSEFGIESYGNELGVQFKNSVVKANVAIDIADYSDSDDVLSGPAISGATKTALIAAVCTDNMWIDNPYLKSDVLVHLDLLSASGFEVVETDSGLQIKRTKVAKTVDPIEYTLNSCVSEVVTYATLAALHGFTLEMDVQGGERIARVLAPEIRIFEKLGIRITISERNVLVVPGQVIAGTNIVVNNEEDSIQSDHHPFFTLLMASKGTRGSIQDNVWSKRFYYAELLKEYGANITISQNRVQIDGPPRWVGRSEVVSGNDVRTSAVLVLLGTQLDRPLFLDGAHHLSRGYVGLVKNLARLGADIEVYIPSLRLVS